MMQYIWATGSAITGEGLCSEPDNSENYKIEQEKGGGVT